MTAGRIGIYGGSFNPIHLGHIAIARHMIERGYVDEVWFMVSPQNPLKAEADLLADELRLEMARKALAGIDPRMKASDYEFALPRPSYTWHTLQSLVRDYPDRRFTLLIGGDNWCRFDRWYHSADILANHPIIIYPRKESNIDPGNLPPGVTLADTCLHNVSSTEVRNILRTGGDVSGMIPENIIPLASKYYGVTTQDGR
ncbi:MAG: nicotinate (nicotinamide) nucleotide adenylyltransferase [Prevotella sp.]